MNVNIDKLMEQFLLLEKSRLWIVYQWKNRHWMVNHQDKPDDQTKDN